MSSLRVLCGALCLVLAGCAGSLRSNVTMVSNQIADVASASNSPVLDAMCASELHAIGHQGHRDDAGHCVRDDAASAATPAQQAALAQARAAWADVRTAYADLADTHDAVVAMIQAGASVSAQDMLSALSHLADAYAAFSAAAERHGLHVAALLGVQ